MKLTPELKFIQEKLVLAAHPWLSLDEARKLELKADWCIVKANINRTWHIDDMSNWEIWTMIDGEYILLNDLHIAYIDWWNWLRDSSITEVVWLPPTLSRVLNYDDDWFYRSWFIYCYDSNMTNQRDKICKWKLLNDDWSDATLFDQSDETITAIAREMWYKSE